MTEIAEKYARSVNSSNLRDDDRHFATDALIALALSPVRLATDMYRVKYCNDATSYKTLSVKWIAIVKNKAELRHWPEHINPVIVANAAMTYWLNPVCPACQGRGFHPKFNQTGAYEATCKPCSGSGTKPVTAEARILNHVKDMVETLAELERYAGNMAVKKLARKMAT